MTEAATGGPKEDWGIKFNYNSGEPAPERITDKIFSFTEKIDSISQADIPDVDLSKIGVNTFGDFEVTLAFMLCVVRSLHHRSP